MSEAIRVFFFSPDFGPLCVVLSLLYMVQWRIGLAPIAIMDGIAVSGSVVFWWIQEHFLHQKLLHSKFDWIGKSIHQGHHDKPYHHVSMDPPALIMGWLLVAHLLLRLTLPNVALSVSATFGYACAGLFYEWAHYLVHTKVDLSKSQFWTQIRDNHIRHHRVSHDYWFGFSLPLIDDLFGTNPTVKQVRQRQRRSAVKEKRNDYGK